MKTSDSLFKDFLPKRNENTSKFDFGRAYLIGGSKEYGGAPLLSLSSLMALRLGAGFSTLFVPEPLYSIYIGREPQVILSLFPSKNGELVYDEEFLSKMILKPTSIAIGMGITQFEETAKVLEFLLRNYKGSLIIDAGALSALSLLDENVFRNKTCDVVLTPHTGEFSRLINVSREEIEKDKMKYSLIYAKRNDITLILKGHQSIITNGTETYINETGNTGLAKAGSGDLLSGILAGIMAQDIKESTTKKAAFCSFLLGKCADYLLKEESDYSIISSDIVRVLPKILKNYVKD